MLLAKPRSPAVGGGEALLRPRRDVVDDLEHRAALVGADAGRVVLDHGHALGRQVAGADVVGGVDGQRLAVDGLGRGVEGVRQRADGDAAPVDPARDAVDALGA